MDQQLDYQLLIVLVICLALQANMLFLVLHQLMKHFRLFVLAVLRVCTYQAVSALHAVQVLGQLQDLLHALIVLQVAMAQAQQINVQGRVLLELKELVQMLFVMASALQERSL